MGTGETHEATVTEGGGIDIPEPVRSRLDIEPGDRVRFRVDEDGSLSVEVVRQRYGAFEDDDLKAGLGGDSLDAHDAPGRTD